MACTRRRSPISIQLSKLSVPKIEVALRWTFKNGKGYAAAMSKNYGAAGPGEGAGGLGEARDSTLGQLAPVRLSPSEACRRVSCWCLRWPVHVYGAAEPRDASDPPLGRLAPMPSSPAEARPRASSWLLRNIKTAIKSVSVSFRALSHSLFFLPLYWSYANQQRRHLVVHQGTT